MPAWHLKEITMRNRAWMAIGAGVLMAAAPAWAQQRDDGTVVRPAQPAEGVDQAMAEMQRLGSPNENHKRLEQLAGTWDVVVTFQMSPDEPEQTSKGSCVNTMIMGGRYLKQEFRGEFMGEPFEGIGFTGYDNAKKHYTSFWMDSMSTWWMTSTGTYDNSKKAWTFIGTSFDPSVGRDIASREVLTINSPTKHTMDFYMTGPDGKEVKSMTIVYTKRNAAGGDDDASR